MNRVTMPRDIALSCLALLLLCVCATARGEAAEGIYFQHGHWEIACDNTLTCRMAGYCAEEEFEGYEDGCASVLITRAAGPDAPLAGKVRLRGYGVHKEKRIGAAVLTLWINDKAKGALKNLEDGGYALAPAQIHALIAAARKDGSVKFVGKDSTESFALSGTGISAVLLKADEIQGRIGTPGALIRKGDKPEARVFPPRPAPIIRAAKVSDAPSRPLTAPELAALKPVLLQDMEGCEAHEQGAAKKEADFTLMPLDKAHVLISTLCWMAAYNWSNVYWVMERTLTGTPKFGREGGSWYEKGELHDAFKGRGVGDCREESSAVWDGQAFRPSRKWTTGMCRGFAGGAWKLPTFITNVINADGTPRAPE
jgi:hypothetical protein